MTTQHPMADELREAAKQLGVRELGYFRQHLAKAANALDAMQARCDALIDLLTLHHLERLHQGKMYFFSAIDQKYKHRELRLEYAEGKLCDTTEEALQVAERAHRES